MSSTHLVIPDPHAHPNYNNDRALWVGKLINDIQPDVVINLGDLADMPSLASFDKGTRAAVGRTYRADTDSAVDFNDKLWSTVTARKRKLPRRVILIGNHEQRIEKAVNSQPELHGAIGLNDLRYDDYYDDVVYYEGGTPGIITIDGISYAHYFPSGVMGRAISGEHPAYSLINKNYISSTQGHTHTVDFCVRTRPDGNKVMGLIAGVYQDYDSPWAGNVNKLWWRGVVIKRDVEDGRYNPEFISIERLREEYG